MSKLDKANWALLLLIFIEILAIELRVIWVCL